MKSTGALTPEERFGVAVERSRIALGMTQVEMTDAMRARGYAWSQAVQSKLEHAKRPIRLNEAADLADILRRYRNDLVAELDTPLVECERAATPPACP